MKNIGSRKNLFRDAAILLTLVVLLIAVPWSKDLWNREVETTATEQSLAPSRDGEMSVTQSRNLAKVQQQQAFIKNLFPLLSTWKTSAIEPYLATATKKDNWENEIGSVLNILSDRLGSMEYYGNPKVVDTIDPVLAEQYGKLTAYEFEAQYQSGAADVNLTLADSNGETVLYSFNIEVHNEIQSL